MTIPDKLQLLDWLDAAGIEIYQCDNCAGLHFADLQRLDGVAECRLFMEPEGLMISAELDLRLSSILPLTADMNGLNVNFPTLKLFTDIVDDGIPQLVASGYFYLQAGISEQQLLLFVRNSLAAIRELVGECVQLDYLAISGNHSGHGALH